MASLCICGDIFLFDSLICLVSLVVFLIVLSKGSKAVKWGMKTNLARIQQISLLSQFNITCSNPTNDGLIGAKSTNERCSKRSQKALKGATSLAFRCKHRIDRSILTTIPTLITEKARAYPWYTYRDQHCPLVSIHICYQWYCNAFFFWICFCNSPNIRT